MTEDGPGERRAWQGTVGVVVPGDWWVVPLEDDRARADAIAALVDARSGADDALRDLRRQLRAEVGAAARRAAFRGGWVLAFLLADVGGLPLTATMTGYRAPGSFADDLAVDRVRDVLRGSVAGSDGVVDETVGRLGRVLRCVRRRQLSHPSASAPPLPVSCVLHVDYWADPGDGAGLLHLAFTTPFVDLEDAFVELFDTVVATLHRDERLEDGDDHPVPS